LAVLAQGLWLFAAAAKLSNFWYPLSLLLLLLLLPLLLLLLLFLQVPVPPRWWLAGPWTDVLPG
jgi:hypothetical protein